MSTNVVKQRAARRPRSVVWYYFDKLPDDQFKAKCKFCDVVCTNVTNTSNLFYHLRHKHPAIYQEAEQQKEHEAQLYNELKMKSGKTVTPVRPRARGRPPGSTNSDFSGFAVVKSEASDSFNSQALPTSTSGRKNYGQGRGRGAPTDVSSAMLHWLATDMLHPSIITKKGFKHFLSACNLRAEVPLKKNVYDTMVPKLVEKTKVQVKQELDAAVSVALSVENWTFQMTQAFLTMTAHFISDNWAMTSYVLETFDCTEDKIETNLAATLKRVTDEWNLTQNVTLLLSDVPDEIMSSAVTLNGWEELTCFGWMLNHVVETGLDSVSEIVHVRKKLSEAVSYFYRSTKASDALATVQQQHSLPESRLKQEHTNLWTSSLTAMERVVEQYEAVNTVLCFLGRDHMCLCDDEVELLRELIQVLKPFQAAVEELCAEPFTCISKLIPIANLLREVTASVVSEKGDEADISGSLSTTEALKASLLAEMELQLSGLESKPALALATLLDPRFKQHAFTDSQALEAAQERLLLLTSDVVKNTDGPAQKVQSAQTNNSSGRSGALWSMFDRKVEDAGALGNEVSEADNETRRFFKEVNILRTADPFQWWRLNEIQFPHLKVLAKRFLCVPATAIPSNRLFYKDGGEFAARRERFRPTSLNNMLFLNQNLD